MVLVEVARKAYLASIVPVIVNAILNEHQIVVDIVAFVQKGDFPRSRLGEKQRGKILASWVTRKMHTMAQFGIRDPESGLSDVTETLEPRSGIGSIGGNGSMMASSLRKLDGPMAPPSAGQNNFIPLPTGLSEMGNFGEISELPDQNYAHSFTGAKDNDTPTDSKSNPFGEDADNSAIFSTDDNFLKETNDSPISPGQRSPLPAVEGRENALWTLPSQAASGGLRVQNAGLDGEDDSWEKDAIMHMNLATR